MTLRDLLYRVGSSVGTIYLLVATFFFVFQRTYIYLPTHTSIQQARLLLADTYSEEWVSQAGTYLGVKRMVNGSQVNYVVFHGNAGEALDRTSFMHLFTHYDLPGDTYVLEYPGYGRRDGTPSKESFFAAADEAIAEIKKVSDKQIILVGESIGSGVAAYEAPRVGAPLRAVLFVTPFNRFGNVVWHHMPFFPTSLLLTENYDNARAIATLRVPIFFVLADNDEVVTKKEGDDLFTSYTGPKKKFVIPNIGHNDVPFDVTTDWAREFRWFLKREE